MSGIATAIVGSAVIGGVVASKSASKQAKAADKAAQSQKDVELQSLELQKELANQQRGDFAPWRDIGQQALQKLWAGVQSGQFNVGQVDVTQDPGYQFRMDQGIEALDKSAAARGRLLSGAQQKGVTNYAQGLASQEYANAYSRQLEEKNRQFNMLSGLSNTGQASAAQQAAATGQLSSNSANILSNLAASQANAEIAKGNASAGAYQAYGQAANQGIQNWLLYKNLGGGAA